MQVVVFSCGPRSARRSLLLEGVRTHHRGAEVAVVRTDARLTDPLGPGEVAALATNPAGHRWADLVLAMGERDAAWAALPWLVELAAGGEGALVLDDSMVLRSELPAALAGGQGASLVGRAAHVDPDSAVAWGGLLPGAVHFPGRPTAVDDWWRARLPELLRGTGGPADLLTVAPSAVALADSSLRVAPGTLGELRLESGPAGVLADDGRPVALLDLAGFDPSQPWWYSPADGLPARVPSQDVALRTLCREVAVELLAHGWSPDQEPADPEPMVGMVADAAMRRWFRGLLGQAPEPAVVPNPFCAGEVGRFVELLEERAPSGASGPTQHLDQVLQDRPDLRAAFPRARWADRPALLRWAWSHGLSEGVTHMAALPPPRIEAAGVRRGGLRPFGVNLTGYLDADLGLGVVARRMAGALRSAGVPVAEVTYDRTSSHATGRRGGDARPYHFNLLVMTPDQLPFYVEDVGAEVLEDHHNIGLWYGETDVLTPRELGSFELVDEVWAATGYLRDVYSAPGRVPVELVPVPLEFGRPPGGPEVRARLGLDERFTFLFSFDFLSVVERKNPLGLLRAYVEAFSPDDGTRLILKSINGHLFPADRERVADAAADRPDVEVRDELLTSEDRMALVAEVDCYVSLHRSEGLGLTMAEAMAMGTPVVATAYSGNLDFMDESSAVLVPATEILIGPGSHYPAEGHWAEPDHARAVEALRAVRSDPELRERLSAAGRRSLERFSSEAVGATALRRLLDVWGVLRTTC